MSPEERCLVCGKPGVPLDAHHWPRTRRYGTATVPLCRDCHTAAHWAKQSVIETLIARAPGYWRSVGEWEQNADEYESWCAKRRYRELTWVH